MPKVEETLAALVAKTSLLRAGPWSIKLFYLCFFGYIGITTAYLGLYLGAIGLTGATHFPNPTRFVWHNQKSRI
jgi:hypothetical protein